MTNCYYTYATLTTPGHSDIEAMLTAICTVITDTSRIAVHAQTINVTGITVLEESRISDATDGVVSDDANVLRTTVWHTHLT
jgi:hypothetical protein